MGNLWNRSGTIERDTNDLPASGALAYFFQGGTTTPMTVYEDAGEATAHEHPVVADAHGRWPAVFIPYAISFDVRTTLANGSSIDFMEEIPNPDPIDLTVTIPAEEKFSTGMIVAKMLTGTIAGFVRLNGRTIGNAASLATERQNADTEDLFTELWNNLSDDVATVSGGRGATAAADYAANKTITLPNMRGATLVGLDSMGNSAAANFTGLTFTTGDKDTPGSLVGENPQTLTEAQLAAHSHFNPRGVPGTGTADGYASDILVSDTNPDTEVTGSGDVINNMQISRLVTWYIKL